MINKQSFVLTALAVGTLVSANAGAQAVEGKFRGAYVCEKTPFTRDILRTPLDLVIQGNNVQFARPLFNLNGTRVLGSELGTGTIDANGKLHLTSTWTYRCTTGKERRITRWEHEHILEAVQRRLDEHPEKMRQRRETVEHPFGTLKMRMGATHFLMKTLPRVASEMALHVLAYNLTRVMNIIGIQPLMAAMRA